MRLRWTTLAAADLAAINEFLSLRLPQYRVPTIRKIRDRIRDLKSNPNIGRPGLVPETRELLLPPLPYIIVYRVRPGAIEVLRIHHGAQQRL